MATKASTNSKQCEKGHIMDPTWASCPYCDAEKRSRQQTKRAPTPQASDSPGKGPVTRYYDAPSKESTRRPDKTRMMGPRHEIPPERGRRIVAVLVTYKSPHEHEGRVFPIYEGRNAIGADKSECDICIDDRQMSRKHASIRYLHGNFEIVDHDTMNGVNVNGTWIPILHGYPLENYAKIITGETEWTFITTAIPGQSKTDTKRPEKETETVTESESESHPKPRTRLK